VSTSDIQDDRRIKVVVTGLGATTPVGATAPSTWSALLAGTSGVRTLEGEWPDDLPVTFAGTAAVDPSEMLDRVEARKLDRTAQFAMILGVLPMILSDGTFKVVQVVDPALNAVTELSILIDGTVNAGMMSGDSAAAPIVLSIAFNVKVSDIGGEFTLEAPADAEMQDMPAGS